MTIYEFAPHEILPLKKTTFSEVRLHERRDLQRLLRENIAVITADSDTMVIAEEFNTWDGSLRRIDLLGIDKDANLIVFELKRTEDGGHMELQAIRYAAMISTMTFEQAVSAHAEFLVKMGLLDVDARTNLLTFLEWEEPDQEPFASEVRIVLASAEFSQELTTAVLWLNEHGLDIRCVRLQPYSLHDRVLVDVQQIIPEPKAADYQIRIREKVRKERQLRESAHDSTKFDLTLGDTSLKGLSKRWAILHTFQYLVKLGLQPEDVARNCGPRANRALVSVEGDVDEATFHARISASRESLGKKFDPVRYFCRSSELLHVGGRTYAFLNQWGGSDWHLAMTNLQNAYPEARLTFSPTENND